METVPQIESAYAGVTFFQLNELSRVGLINHADWANAHRALRGESVSAIGDQALRRCAAVWAERQEYESNLGTTRQERIAIAADICGVRLYSVDLDAPLLVLFQLEAIGRETAYQNGLAVAAMLTGRGFRTTAGSPLSAGNDWFRTPITVDVGADQC